MENKRKGRGTYTMLQNASLFAVRQLQFSLIRLFAVSFQGHQLSTCPFSQAITYNPWFWWDFTNKKQGCILETKSQKEKHIWESLLRQISHQSRRGQGPPQIVPFTISQQWEQVWTNFLCFSLCFPFLSLLLPFGSHPRMFLSVSMWYFGLIQANQVCMRSW